MINFNKLLIALAFVVLSAGAVNAQTSGSCGANGNNLTWQLTGTGSNLTLTISGTGVMADYYGGVVPAPWYSQRANIKTLVLENGMTTIGNVAFSDCSSLTGALTIPNSVTTIGLSAFSHCSGLTGALTIGNSVTTIGDYAFQNCSGLTSVTIPNNVTTIGSYAFENCSGLTGALAIPNSITAIDQCTFRGCSGLTSVTIPNSIMSIGSYAFSGCSGLISVINYKPAPQNIPTDVFSTNTYAYATLYVLSTSVNLYLTANGWKNFSSVLGSAGIDEIVTDHISIYPNPAQNEIKIDGGDLQINRVEICDLAGRVVQFGQPQGSPLQINVSALPVGIYLVKIHTDKGVVTRKVVKN